MVAILVVVAAARPAATSALLGPPSELCSMSQGMRARPGAFLFTLVQRHFRRARDPAPTEAAADPPAAR